MNFDQEENCESPSSTRTLPELFPSPSTQQQQRPRAISYNIRDVAMGFREVGAQKRRIIVGNTGHLYDRSSVSSHSYSHVEEDSQTAGDIDLDKGNNEPGTCAVCGDGKGNSNIGHRILSF